LQAATHYLQKILQIVLQCGKEKNSYLKQLENGAFSACRKSELFFRRNQD